MPNALSYYMQGQQAVENNKRNKLLQMQVENAPAEQARRNKLLDLQVGNQQQSLDAGKFDLDNAKQKQALQESAAGLGYIIDSPTPKAEAERRYPKELSQLRQQIPDLDSFSDEEFRAAAAELRNQVNAQLGVGPAPKQPKLITRTGPNGQVIQEDPVTGKVTQAIAPQEDFRAKAEFTDKLARQRDAEQRQFTLGRDASNAELQRELALQRSRSKDEKATDGQRLSAGFLIRMQDTEPSFGSANAETGEFVPSYKPSTKDFVLFNKILKNEGGLFGSGTAAELNKQLPPEAQEYFQQAQDWVRAKLRKESGAVISPQEMLSEIATYFPLPGDSPKTIQNKARSREVAIEAMRIAAGSTGANTEAPPRQRQQPAQAGPPQPKQIVSEAEYNSLPSGAQYIGPDGKLRQKR